MESYRRLSIALLYALETLGLTASAEKEYSIPEGSQPNAAVCFEVPSNYEITVNGKKLIGSAQARKHRGVLQHGSLPLCGDLTRIIQALKFSDQEAQNMAARRLLDHAATVETLSGRIPSWEEAADAFKAGFQHVLGINFITAAPSAIELLRTTELVHQKYAHPDWTNRI